MILHTNTMFLKCLITTNIINKTFKKYLRNIKDEIVKIVKVIKIVKTKN